jgi:FG-GAP-like repeat
MGHRSGWRPSWRLALLFAAALIAGAGSAAAYFLYGRAAGREPGGSQSGEDSVAVRPAATATSEIEDFCTRCHAYPPADTFPRSAWNFEVNQAYKFFAGSNLYVKAPPIDDVIRYYEERAPLELALPVIPRPAHPLPVRFEQKGIRPPPGVSIPGVSNVNLVHLFDERRLDLLACDMRAGLVLALSPYRQAPAWQVLGRVPNPAHAEVVDLDGDGIKDILVANLGSMDPEDHYNGSVVWLRGHRDGHFTPVTLLDKVGRVADVQAADFRKQGKLDLVVAEFGYLRTGKILYLENQTTDWDHPVFTPHQMDDRHGGIHVPVGDINGDGRPDFVALISQEHETVVAFLNEGNGRFREETIYTGPHPAYGSSGIQLVDINGDGKLDVLYTNGDTMDPPFILRPYHSVQWLENQGRFPFVHHPITPMFGVHRAVAADFRGCGKLDIVAVSYLPSSRFPERQERRLDAVIYLEQIAPNEFARHSLETVTCDHVTCASGDIFGTGRIDFVTGNLLFDPTNQAVTVWKNLRP